MPLDLADAIDDVRAELEGAAPDIFTDLCSLTVMEATPDGYGGTEYTPNEIAADIPCRYRALSERERLAGGAVVASMTHELTMPFTDDTRAIKPHYRIAVEAHHGIPELIFENPITLDGSMDVFLRVLAAVKE